MSADDTGHRPPRERDILEGTWWFPARRFLPGWGLPVRWQGWVLLAAYLALLVVPGALLRGHHAAALVGYALVLTVIFGIVVAKKGEPLH